MHTHTHSCMLTQGMYTHSHMLKHTHARTQACTHSHMLTFAYLHMYTCSYTGTFTHSHTCAHTHTHAHTQACTHSLTHSLTHCIFVTFFHFPPRLYQPSLLPTCSFPRFVTKPCCAIPLVKQLDLSYPLEPDGVTLRGSQRKAKTPS